MKSTFKSERHIALAIHKALYRAEDGGCPAVYTGRVVGDIPEGYLPEMDEGLRVDASYEFGVLVKRLMNELAEVIDDS